MATVLIKSYLDAGLAVEYWGGTKVKVWGRLLVQISEEGIALIKKFEGCRLESYLCSAGVLTIGYGHTREVLEGAQITQGEADDMLWEDIKSFEGYVNDLVFVPLEQCQFDALVCWTFNLWCDQLSRIYHA